MDDNPLDAIFWRDELLQILYWFRGEGLGDAVAPRDLLPFLDADEESIRQHLERLAEDSYVTCSEDEPPHYELTEWGVKEGGRRFADEFAGLTNQAHGECNNPTCACKTMGPEACETHGSHTH
ncbi:MAG TPA: hypothetical protein DEP84_27040 [Chloroflexi bacterium]|nr:hypothetical protein [Chloroflexota bacterium]